MNVNETALIVIDSGFSLESIRRAKRVIAVYDLRHEVAAIGSPTVPAETLARFAGDPMKHGSIVLDRLTSLLPDAPYILIRAFSDENSVLRTKWAGGTIAREGWTEAYRWAVELCRKNGLRSVANCSFGGFIHAMDGTGWEAFQLAKETGPGKPNHIVVAATGPGDARSSHASWHHLPCETVTVNVRQEEASKYNLWTKGGAWQLTVLLNGEVVQRADGRYIPENFWNHRQQLTFWVEGEGHVQFIIKREHGTATTCGDSASAQRFDVWIAAGDAAFLNHVDPTLISEPAVFPNVLSAGLRSGTYCPTQMSTGSKPDVLLPGNGPISFRAPEVAAAIARLLMESAAGLDVDQVRSLLGKFPDCVSLAQSGLRT